MIVQPQRRAVASEGHRRLPKQADGRADHSVSRARTGVIWEVVLGRDSVRQRRGCVGRRRRCRRPPTPVVRRVRHQLVVVEDVGGPWVYGSKTDEEVNGRGPRRGSVLRAQDDGVGAPLELGLGEGIGDGGAVEGEEGWGGDGGVDFDGLDADDEGIVVCDVDGLDAVVGLGRVSKTSGCCGGTDLDERWIQEPEFLLTEVGEVPEGECAIVLQAACDERRPGKEMEFPDTLDGG